MRVFVTGATGFIGSALVPELINAGHKVLGLTRSDAGAKSLAAAGAEVHRGSLEDLESLKSGAAKADSVIHLAFIHDFSKFQENCETDRRAIEALGSALAGSDRLLIATSGTLLVAPGRLATEEDAPSGTIPRLTTAEEAAALAGPGVRICVVRLPQVHDQNKQGLVTYLIDIAREKGVSAFVGDGMNRWSAAHLSDTARLYRLALEKGSAGCYHAVAEEGVPVRDIAEVIGRRLKLPVVGKTPAEAADHFGTMGGFAGLDGPASSALTRERLGWRPVGPGLIADLQRAHNLEI
ncbi:MAG TPA: SDR family oxidoreductase [Candidatus Eremiobacteraceae bacterium]|nr:SDR family oxidoreductase [Candidatus Eremiobacteraceae bacterium]